MKRCSQWEVLKKLPPSSTPPRLIDCAASCAVGSGNGCGALRVWAPRAPRTPACSLWGWPLGARPGRETPRGAKTSAGKVGFAQGQWDLPGGWCRDTGRSGETRIVFVIEQNGKGGKKLVCGRKGREGERREREREKGRESQAEFVLLSPHRRYLSCLPLLRALRWGILIHRKLRRLN